MAEERLTTESPNLRGRWIRYVHTDEDSGRDHIAVTQIVSVDVTYARPLDHKVLDPADKIYVEWLLEQDGQGKIARVDIMTLSPVQVLHGDDAVPMITVDYSALGKPMKVVEFSMATVPEVLTVINRLAERHPDKASALIEHYNMTKTSDGNLVFQRR